MSMAKRVETRHSRVVGPSRYNFPHYVDWEEVGTQEQQEPRNSRDPRTAGPLAQLLNELAAGPQEPPHDQAATKI